MFVKTGVFRHFFFMSFLLLCSFQRAFCCDLFRLASLPLEKVRPRRKLRVPRFFFATPRHTKNLFAKTFASAFFRITSPFLEKFVRVALLRVPLFSSSCLVLREKSFAKTFALAFALAKNKMVGLGRLELLTSRLSGVRSNQLSYRPIKWWRRGESNS